MRRVGQIQQKNQPVSRSQRHLCIIHEPPSHHKVDKHKRQIYAFYGEKNGGGGGAQGEESFLKEDH